MIVLMILAGILALILILLLLPLRGTASYGTLDGTLNAKLRYTFFTIFEYPGKENPKKEARKKAKEEKKKKKEQPKETGEEKLSKLEQLLRDGGVVEALSYLSGRATLAGTTVKKLLKSTIVNSIRLRVVVASGDAAQTALDYGKICAVVYPAEALFETLTRVKHRSIVVSPDFLKEKGEADIFIKARILPIRILWVGILFIFGYIGQDTHREKEQERSVEN